MPHILQLLFHFFREFKDLRLRNHAFHLLSRFDHCLQRDLEASFKLGCYQAIGWIDGLMVTLGEPGLILCSRQLVRAQFRHSAHVCLLGCQDLLQEIELGWSQCLKKGVHDHCFQASAIDMQARCRTIVCGERRTGVASLRDVRSPASGSHTVHRQLTR